MKDHHKDNLGWAQKNGYDFHADSKGPIFEGAGDLDIFRKSESFRNHVLGIYRNRQFEIIDFRKETSRRGYFGFVNKTVVLIPTAGLALPDFELLPRRETRGMNFLGIKGLDLKLDANAPQEERRMVDAFNKNYSLFAGGTFEAVEASLKSADHLVPSLSDVDSICKPGVLRFLSTASTGWIEVQNGYLAVIAPDTRIIRGTNDDTILEGRERESLLAVANDLLDVLANASREAPLRNLTLENTFHAADILGSIIGAALGFFLGSFVGILLLFLINKNYLFLSPVLSFGGAALGGYIGKRLTRAR